MAPPSRGRASNFSLGHLAEDLSSYGEGAILYMSMVDFITYERCELYPGPHMNMLMGPNGSGKSSLVAAMVLGLGWPAAILGRSKDVGEFVRYGRDRAILEIALKMTDSNACMNNGRGEGSPRGRRPRINDATDNNSEDDVRARTCDTGGKEKHEGDDNDDYDDDDDGVGDGKEREGKEETCLRSLNGRDHHPYVLVRREIIRGRGGKTTSDWFINGHASAAKTVSLLMHKLHIQIDNLCQFLPQDKVADFARMTPAELLRETEKAAAAPVVHEQHLSLIELRGGEVLLQASVEENMRKMTSLARQNENIEQIIQRLEERESHLRLVRLCERKRPWLVYNAARDAFLEAKNARDAAKAELERAEMALSPLKAELTRAKDAMKLAERQRSKLVDKISRAKAEVDGLLNGELEEIARSIESLKVRILHLRDERAKRSVAIADVRRTIVQIEAEIRALSLQEHAVEDDPYRKELQRMTEEMNEIQSTMEEAETQIGRISSEGGRLQSEVDLRLAELRRLDDVRAMRLEIIQRMAADVRKAHDWIQENKRAFVQSVYGPICLEVTLKDPAISRQVESALSKSHLLNFVVTCEEDLETFQATLCDAMQLRVNVTLIEEGDAATTATAGRPSRQELDRNELRRLGFAGCLIDFLEAPQPVLETLMDTAKVHLIPVTAQGSISCERVESSHIRIQKYATADGTYEIKRSPYTNEVCTREMPLKKNQLLGGPSISGEEHKAVLMERISGLRVELARNSDRMRRILREKEGHGKRLTTLRTQRDGLAERRRTWLEQVVEVRRKHQQRELKQSSLEKLLAAEQANEEGLGEERAKEELRAFFMRHADTTLQAVAAFVRCSELVLSMGGDHLDVARLEDTIGRLQAEVDAQDGQFEEGRRILAVAEADVAEKKALAKDLLEKATRDDQLDEATREAFSELPETLEELDRLLAVERTKAEMSNEQGITAQTVRDYEQRKVAIAQVESVLMNQQRELRALEEQMTNIEREWRPALQVMTENINRHFSAFFASMGCVGEVRLRESESHPRDYSQWSLEILVKFRDEASLQVLSAQKQSGGEKSVSTILFLLSLQGLTFSPFRVVDEINQGMDAANERRVHSLIVKTATNPNNSQ